MVEGTAVVGSPLVMNCSTAICAVASCIATRSACACMQTGQLSMAASRMPHARIEDSLTHPACKAVPCWSAGRCYGLVLRMSVFA